MERRSRTSPSPDLLRSGKVDAEAPAASAVGRLLVLFLLVCLSVGCRGKQKSAPASAVDAAAPAASSLGKRPITTSAAIAWNNLNGEIEERLRKDDPTPARRLHLVQLLLSRSQTLASIADLERADGLAERAVAESPNEWESHMARGVAHAALHRFDAASAELDAALALKAPAGRVSEARVSVEIARGQYDEAAARFTRPEKAMDSTDLTTLAVLRARTQKPAEADRLFELARTRFDSVAPFPLAWMDFQRAMVLDAEGREELAREYYAEACEILPEYAHAAIHLSASEPPAKAIERLTALRKTSDDPDLLAALAKAHERAGQAAEKRRLLDEARRRFDEVVAVHREAFADHAARFWLNGGADPKKALDLARANAKVRSTEEALDLWSAAAAATGSKDDACASAAAMSLLPHAGERSRRLASALLPGCPDAGR